MQALLTLAEARKVLKISKTKLYHERQAGRLHVVTIGVRCVRVTEAEVKRYIRAAREPRGHLIEPAPIAPRPGNHGTRSRSDDPSRAIG